jgi:AraC-like DNA-binding protein
LDPLFKIFKIHAEDAERISLQPNAPHTHAYEELIVVEEGQLEHFIDFRKNHYQAPLVSFVTKGKSHRAVPRSSNGACNIWVIRFKSEFIAESTFHYYSLFHSHADIVFQRGYEFQRITDVCRLMYNEYQREFCNYAVIKQMLSLLFTMLEVHPAVDKKQLLSENNTFRNFLSILEVNYRRPMGVEFYAERLFMSVRNLNRICQGILEQSVGEIIETRKLIEAKHLLLSTDKSVSEIGFELGYKEKSYFTNVFKKKLGLTPTEFREEMKKVLS